MSDDGERVVGTADQAGETRSFIWTATTGMQSLGNLPSFASGISADGSAVVGTAGFNGLRAFRWTVAGGFQNLGSLFEGGTSRASAVSGDGSVVIGTADGLGIGHNGISERAFIWTEGGGMVDLAVYLQGRGVDCSEWVFTNVRSISADATTIVGSGQYRGENRAFVITIPTPSCLLAIALSAGFAMRRRR
jgi:probable HAF family extracellular repeat protein